MRRMKSKSDLPTKLYLPSRGSFLIHPKVLHELAVVLNLSPVTMYDHFSGTPA